MKETGIVKSFDREKGCGFIERENAPDIFVYRTGIQGGYEPLEVGETVEFEVKQGAKGPQAIAVLPVKRMEINLKLMEKMREFVKRKRASSPSDFTIIFDPALTEDEIKGAFEALADYYRSCGGVGLAVDFELEGAEVLEPIHA